MHRTSYSALRTLVIVLGITLVLGQAPARNATTSQSTKAEDFTTAIKKLRDTWVAHNYIVHSLHAEHSGDLGYDTGIYNENFPHHLAEGNYLVVVKRIKGEWKIVAHAAVPNPRQN